MNFLSKNPIKKYWWLAAVILILIVSGGSWLVLGSSKKAQPKVAGNPPATNSAQNNEKRSSGEDADSTDPVTKGKYLSGGNCTGKGSKKLGSAPMKIGDISYILPYGLLAGGHVTPIDHGYYWGKVPMGDPDMYDVLSLSDGKIVNLSYRSHDPVQYPNSKIKGDYRAVIMYSCTFFSYFDLATSLSPEIAKQLPANWETEKKNIGTDINIKEGQVIAKVGGQSLDFAVWDTTKFLKNLLVPTAYNNAEPWKINTVAPLDYFTDSVKKQILPFYLRTVEPRDGIIDQDIDARAAGGWFLEGTNGYAGVFSYGTGGGGQNGYWSGHLALVRDLYDPTGWVFSGGDIGGQAQQFAIKDPFITPDKLETSSGLVKYELGQWNHIDGTGNMWTGQAFPKGEIKMSVGPSQGTVLVQLLEKRKLKIEVFLGKTPSQVSAFDANAKTYDRGEGAKLIKSNTDK